MKIDGNQFLSIEQLQAQYLNPNKAVEKKAETKDGLSFEEILNQKTATTANSFGDVKFSKHAANRLMDRNISLTKNQMERLKEGTQKASAKGINESLVLVDQLAFIVNIPNSTVITAMDQTETNENVFTNIDGAVII